MIIYNTTFHADNVIAADCLAYLKSTYIPIAIKNGLLQKPALRRLMREDDDGTTSYALQFHVDHREALDTWMQKEGRILQRRLTQRFGHQLVGFSTLLEEIELDGE